MGERRSGRECALQLLFQMDITGDDVDTAILTFWQLKKRISNSAREFCEKLARGYWKNREKVDKIISENASNWRLDRMAVVDRNILRMAIYEFLFEEDIPPKVSINEGIEIAKNFGGPESTQFINGILDAVKNKIDQYKS
jgi:N utilization substance protein B